MVSLVSQDLPILQDAVENKYGSTGGMFVLAHPPWDVLGAIPRTYLSFRWPKCEGRFSKTLLFWPLSLDFPQVHPPIFRKEPFPMLGYQPHG